MPIGRQEYRRPDSNNTDDARVLYDLGSVVYLEQMGRGKPDVARVRANEERQLKTTLRVQIDRRDFFVTSAVVLRTATKNEDAEQEHPCVPPIQTRHRSLPFARCGDRRTLARDHGRARADENKAKFLLPE